MEIAIPDEMALIEQSENAFADWVSVGNVCLYMQRMGIRWWQRVLVPLDTN